jgi:hypothetical protein
MWAVKASAFHDEGVAYCAGCHTMHNSQNGVPVSATGPHQYLLKMETPSDVCLSCHSQTSATSLRGRDVFSLSPTAPNPEVGGGDFAFLTEDNINDGHNGGQPANWIPGYKAGHSIVAPSKGLVADLTLTSAPGGDFPSSILGCSSCHDPHGNEEFRLLNGAGDIQAGLYNFTNPWPDADGIALISGASGGESQTNHTAYMGGMSEWCGNCHGDFHNSGELIHPSGEAIGGTISTMYGLYNGTGDQTGGSAATAYITDVPFEDGANTISSTAGPSASSKVSCITCHRSHATSAPDAGRWDFALTLLEEDGLESLSYPIPNSYVSNAGYEQRSLCNKCHNKDEHDALNP